MKLSKPSGSSEWKTRKTLIEKVSDGCETSWQEFFQIYRRFVSSIAFKSGVAPCDVDDLAQGVFLEVHRDFSKPDPPEFGERSFGAWLGQKVKWRVIEYHRHRHRREIATDPGDLAESDANRPFDLLWDHEWERKMLEVAMLQIAEKPRNLLIFQALAIQDTSVEEVCKMFAISRSNADTIKKRVKDKLKPIIQEIEAGVALDWRGEALGM